MGADKRPSDLIAEKNAWQKLARARGRILIAYRTNGPVPGKAIDDANDACATLRRLGVDPHA